MSIEKKEELLFMDNEFAKLDFKELSLDWRTDAAITKIARQNNVGHLEIVENLIKLGLKTARTGTVKAARPKPILIPCDICEDICPTEVRFISTDNGNGTIANLAAIVCSRCGIVIDGNMNMFLDHDD